MRSTGGRFGWTSASVGSLCPVQLGAAWLSSGPGTPAWPAVRLLYCTRLPPEPPAGRCRVEAAGARPARRSNAAGHVQAPCTVHLLLRNRVACQALGGLGPPFCSFPASLDPCPAGFRRSSWLPGAPHPAAQPPTSLLTSAPRGAKGERQPLSSRGLSLSSYCTWERLHSASSNLNCP